MTWARLDDKFPAHPKIVGLSDGAFRLHVMAICYAAEHGTDGAISAAIARSLVGPRAVKLASELCAALVWDMTTDGFSVHDFLHYNPSREDLESRRASKRIAGAKGGATAALHRLVRQRTANGSTPVPVPDPVPDQPTEAAADRALFSARGETAAGAAAVSDVETRCYRAFDGLIGSFAVTPMVGQAIRDWIAGSPWAFPEQPAELFEAACAEGAVHGAKNLKYVFAILERWQREGQKDTRKKAITDSNGQGFVSGFSSDELRVVP